MPVDSRPRYDSYIKARPFREATPAQVAELVDALASGASDLMVVEVQVLFWAPDTKRPRYAWPFVYLVAKGH